MIVAPPDRFASDDVLGRMRPELDSARRRWLQSFQRRFRLGR